MYLQYPLSMLCGLYFCEILNDFFHFGGGRRVFPGAGFCSPAKAENHGFSANRAVPEKPDFNISLYLRWSCVTPTGLETEACSDHQGCEAPPSPHRPTPLLPPWGNRVGPRLQKKLLAKCSYLLHRGSYEMINSSILGVGTRAFITCLIPGGFELRYECAYNAR